MPRGVPRNGGAEASAADRIKAAESAIRKLQLAKRKLDLDIQKLQLDIDAAKEEEPAPAAGK